MLKRTLTGLVILLVTAGFVLLKQFNSLFFDAFALIIMYASIIEVINAYKKAGKKAHTAVLLCLPAMMFIAISIVKHIYADYFYSIEKLSYATLISFIIIAVVALMVFLTIDIISAGRLRKKNQEIDENFDAFAKTKISMQILAYPILPLSFFFLLNIMPYDVGYIGIILTFAVAMMTDTCAYLFGRAWGKRKFIPEVSPKKTIAGVVGGFIGGLAAASLCFLFVQFTSYFWLFKRIVDFESAKYAFLIIGLIGSYINQLGDLIASSLKRKVGIKDFSNIFPGHGGFMDRVDGQMFVAVFVYLIFTIFFSGYAFRYVNVIVR